MDLAAVVKPKLPTSPCVGVCTTDVASGLCLGCGRTTGEIAAWRDASPVARDAVWAELPARRKRLGIRLHRLRWTNEEIGQFVAKALRDRSGTWVFGVPGALAEFSIAAGEAADIAANDIAISASTSRGAIRINLLDGVRALALEPGEGEGQAGAILLTLIRGRLAMPRHGALAPLGPDREAIRPEDREQRLYDLGIDMPVAQFCIRTADPDLARQLDAASGLGWRDLLVRIGVHILHAAPHRVVRTPIGRAEVFTAIPPPGGASPAGPHTHLLQEFLGEGRETPQDVDLPSAYAPGAIFYSNGRAALPT
jgi:predicted Fe-S protein YdhL (DUF1289 family)